VSTSPGQTCFAKRTWNRRIASGPNQSFTTRAANPIVSMPWPKTEGLPTWAAIVSSWCIGLKSPLAPAYFTNIVRVSGGNSCARSSPIVTASFVTAAT
jgi:hypothetical protein